MPQKIEEQRAEPALDADVTLPKGGTKSSKYNFVEFKEISVEDIENNPRNPRPKYQLKEDDEYLAQLGDSIKTEGQHRPAIVYEIVDHYFYDDKPGKYMLLQGESRWMSCKVAGVPTLRCFIAETPKDLVTELEWLGNEEAFKRDWQPFFQLRYARDLALESGIPLVSSEISSKTGCSMSDLKLADKVFKLAEEIQAFVIEYEQIMYEQYLTGKRKKKSRIIGAKVKASEFPVAKAAVVYDVFSALRTHMPQLVREFSDVDLQYLLAVKASRATIDDMAKLNGQIRQGGDNPPPGLISQMSMFLDMDGKDARETLRSTGGSNADLAEKFVKKAASFTALANRIISNSSQLGLDKETIQQAQMEAVRLQALLLKVDQALGSAAAEIRKNS